MTWGNHKEVATTLKICKIKFNICIRKQDGRGKKIKSMQNQNRKQDNTTNPNIIIITTEVNMIEISSVAFCISGKDKRFVAYKRLFKAKVHGEIT